MKLLMLILAREIEMCKFLLCHCVCAIIFPECFLGFTSGLSLLLSSLITFLVYLLIAFWLLVCTK